MDKDEPIDADAPSPETTGSGSSPDGEQAEIDLREPVEDAKSAAGKGMTDSSAADRDEVVVNNDRPAPPPRPDVTASTDDRPEPPTLPSSEPDDSSAADARPEPPDVSQPAADAPDETSTPLIDLGEAIADERQEAPSAWWKYAAAIAVPIAVAAVLLFALTGRGDDDSPEFTRGEGTELATGADPDDADSATSDTTSESEAATSSDDSSDDGAGEDSSDENTATENAAEDQEVRDEDVREDEETEEAASEDAAEATEPDTATSSSDDDQDASSDDDQAADASSGDEPRESAERVEAAPTEVPDPTPEPDNDSADSADGDASQSAGDQDAASTDTSESGSAGTGSVQLADRTMTAEPSTGAFALAVPEGSPYDAFTTVEHASGTVAVSVPTAFTYLDIGPDTGDEVIVASFDEIASLDTPGVTIRRVTDGDLAELDNLLAESAPDFVADCTVLTVDYELPAPLGYEGLFFADRLIEDDGVRGSMIFYESCLYGEEATAIVQAGLIDNEGDMVIVTANLASTADLEVLDRVLSTVTF